MEDKKQIVRIDAGLKELIPGYLEDIRNWITQEIPEAVRRGDYGSIRALSHKMAGTGSGYGIDQITLSGKQINQAAHATDGAAVCEIATVLAKYLQNIEFEYIDDEDDLYFDDED